MTEESYLAHYGILRRSGRYPWGSGKDQNQRNKMFVDIVAELRKEGMSEAEIARGFGLTTTQLRAAKSIAKNELKAAQISQAQRLKDRGWSNVAIGERMGINESSVRSLLAPGAKDKADVLETTSNFLKDQVNDKGYIDVGSGVEHHVGVSRTKLDVAVARLQEDGYKIHYVNVQQLGTGKMTKMKVLGGPDSEWVDVVKNTEKIKSITGYSDDGGRTFLGIEPPISISSKRVAVNYAEDGGTQADGVIYVRPGVDDVSLGQSNYAQVRIAVDGTHYLKGMAVYKSDLPPGVDLVFNTNKSKAEVKSKLEVMKPFSKDPDNPFGASIKPGGQRGVMNIVNEEGDWQEWSRTLSSQMLSKQSPLLAKTQLDMTFERKTLELDEILSITNPAVKRRLLESFADDADASAVHLKAAALPRQNSHVIMPVNSLKSTEVYAPNFNDGERVVLVRYPHGGIFEIPELTVNNRHRDARKLLGPQAKDAIGINAKVAERLSGADFDGDTVLVIPNNQGKIKTAAALEGLKNFDPKRTYPAYEGMKPMSARTKQIEMGKVSNLITDMTIRGASGSELARAVRHSMVVIDAEKHELNYKLSAEVNGIAQLKEKYQGGKRHGAATLISRKKSKMEVNERKQGFRIDPATGKKVFIETGASYVDKKTGKLIIKKEKVNKLAETSDAHKLSSGTPIEKVYADHSNRLKDLANTARKEQVSIKNTPYSPSAKETYSTEVSSLNAKLNVALRNKPLERQAQVLGNAVVQKKRAVEPNMDPAEVKKLRGQALEEARTRTGAKKQQITLTPREWEAIQAGAITNNKLTQILSNSDLDTVKQLALPRKPTVMTSSVVRRAKQMAAAGYTQAEIAAHLGVSATSVSSTLSEGG